MKLLYKILFVALTSVIYTSIDATIGQTSAEQQIASLKAELNEKFRDLKQKGLTNDAQVEKLDRLKRTLGIKPETVSGITKQALLSGQAQLRRKLEVDNILNAIEEIHTELSELQAKQ